LKQRQTKILAFIKDFTTRHPYPPALREIVEGCGLSSTSVAQYNLRLLEQRGYLTRVPAAARGIALTERGRAWSPVPLDSPGREAAA
jgi:repressor LexA